jgi:hypothetical protein
LPDSGKRAMKKHNDPSLPVIDNASLEFIINHIVEMVQITSARKQTKTQKQAAQILARCLANRYEANWPSPFSHSDKSDTVVDASQLWLSGDLAIGRGGSEFMYVYSAIGFVEDLLVEALKLTSAPIKASLDGQVIEGKFPARSARRQAATFTTAGTVYLLNNLRDKLNESIEDLFVEARTVVEELQRSTLESGFSELAGVNNDATQMSQARFTQIIKTIIAEGNNRRRKRLRKAFWEIARGRGRPKGTRAPRESQRFSKSEFVAQLTQKIRGLSNTSESEVTRKAVAHALGLPNEKALDRLRQQFGDKRGWRECVAQILAGD